MREALAVALVTSHCLQVVLSAKILALCAVASHSHSLWCYKYMEALAERGHQITVFGVDQPKIKIPNLKTFIADGVYDQLDGTNSLDVWIPKTDSKLAILDAFQMWAESTTNSILRSQALKDLINEYRDFEKPFDLIIHDNANVAALLGLVPLFGNPPLLLATTYGTPQWMTERVGNLFNPAYVPNMISDFDQHMTFLQRIENTFYYLAVEWFTRMRFEPFQDEMKREVFGDKLPGVRELAKRVNIVIVNHHPVLDDPRPLLPGVIGVAGLHISEPQPLPSDIQEFIDGAEHGVILLSFGSNIDSQWFSKDFESQILECLGSVPQRVLWKWDKTPAKVPRNVKIGKWLPQADILAHPKLRLFVTHCGLLSTQEAIFRKVPMLALPVFLDQHANAVKLAKRNLTIILNIRTLSAHVLRDGINEILSNPKYKENTARLGSLVQDMPMTAKQQAMYWTEYVLRHHGATHLRSAAADLPWYQLILLDVITLVVTVILVTLWLVKTVFVFVMRKLSHSIKKKFD